MRWMRELLLTTKTIRTAREELVNFGNLAKDVKKKKKKKKKAVLFIFQTAKKYDLYKQKILEFRTCIF